MWVGKGGGSKGGWAPKGGAPKGGGPERVGAQNFSFFFPCPAAKFILFFLLWGSCRGILVVFEAPGRSNVHVWALGLSCASPGPPPVSFLTFITRSSCNFASVSDSVVSQSCW